MYSYCQPRPKNKQSHLWVCSSFNASSCSVNNFILTEIGTLGFVAELILRNSPIKLWPYSFSFKPHKLLPESTHATLQLFYLTILLVSILPTVITQPTSSYSPIAVAQGSDEDKIPDSIKPKKNRCFTCRKRVGLTGEAHGLVILLLVWQSYVSMNGGLMFSLVLQVLTVDVVICSVEFTGTLTSTTARMITRRKPLLRSVRRIQL